MAVVRLANEEPALSTTLPSESETIVAEFHPMESCSAFHCESDQLTEQRSWRSSVQTSGSIRQVGETTSTVSWSSVPVLEQATPSYRASSSDCRCPPHVRYSQLEDIQSGILTA